MFESKLGPAEVAVLETFVVPQYLSLFGDAALNMLLTGDVAAIAHLGCRTGYPDRELMDRVSNCSIVGVDASAAAIQLARNKAAAFQKGQVRYTVATDMPTRLPAGGFSHALSLHPIGGREMRGELFSEMERLLYAGGQALVALPLRGSFQELADLLREYALKHDEGEFGKTLDLAVATRPTIETLSEELESAGFDDIDVAVMPTQLGFESGRAFTEDPTTRLLILPEIVANLGIGGLGASLDYARDAIDKYWSESDFQLTINIGCASARKH